MLRFRNNFKRGTLPAISIFAFVLVTVWSGSDNIRIFFLNILETVTISFVSLFVLSVLFQSPDKEEYFQPVLLWWSVMTLILTLGRF